MKNKIKCFLCDNEVGYKSYILCDECFDDCQDEKKRIDHTLLDLAIFPTSDVREEAIKARAIALNRAMPYTYLYGIHLNGVDGEPVIYYYKKEVEDDLVIAFRNAFKDIFFYNDDIKWWLENDGIYFDYQFAMKVNDLL